MGYRESAELATFPPFRGRCEIAMVTAARDVIDEAVHDTERYRLRRALAVNVLSDPDVYSVRFSWAAASDETITLESTDSEIQYTVDTSWDGIAGAPQPE